MAKDEDSAADESGSNPLSILLAQQVEREQRVAALGEWAASLRDYYVALVKEGFTANQALELTIVFQSDATGRCET